MVAREEFPLFEGYDFLYNSELRNLEVCSMKINLNDLMTLIRSGREEFSLEDIESLTGKEL